MVNEYLSMEKIGFSRRSVSIEFISTYFKRKLLLKSGNACCYSVQNLLSSSLLSRNLNIKINRTISLPDLLYGCETWSLTLREERRLRVFENRVLRRIFWSKRDEVKESGENYVMGNLMFCTRHPILFGW